MPATALPPDPPASLQGSQHALNAYARILPLQNQRPFEIRICGWMLIHAPTMAGRDYVATCITRCDDDAAIFKLGTNFNIYFIKYFKATLHKNTSPPSSHPSRPSLDMLRDQIRASLVETPKDHRDAKKHALIRDDYRCLLSRRLDVMYYLDHPELHAMPDIQAGGTQCSHILPQYLGQGLDDPYRLDASATVWAVLQIYGGVPANELSGHLMHSLTNILTLESQYHDAFDSLYIWLEPVEGADNTYSVGRRLPGLYTELPAQVTFQSQMPNLPLPDPRYLALHAACAKVIHLSGAAEFIDRILKDSEETKVMSEDGTSGELLAYLLYSAETAMAY